MDGKSAYYVVRAEFRRWMRWLSGWTVCLDEHKSGGAFCKRRPGHFGKHRTGDGFTWEDTDTIPYRKGPSRFFGWSRVNARHLRGR